MHAFAARPAHACWLPLLGAFTRTRRSLAGDRLPLELCHGYVVDLAAPQAAQAAQQHGFQGPSLLGSTYLAAQARHLI
jgi:hypothetical protein